MLYTRSQQNVTNKYPELIILPKHVRAKSAILDGEIVALKDGIPSFELMQQRMNLQDQRAIQTAVYKVPVIYYVFDILELDGKSLLKLPLVERKKILKRVIRPAENIKFLPHFENRDEILSKGSKSLVMKVSLQNVQIRHIPLACGRIVGLNINSRKKKNF